MSGPAEIATDDFVFVPIAEATEPPAGLVVVYKDHWWAVDDQDRIAFYNPLIRNARGARRRSPWMGSPQCNAHRTVTERVSADRPWYREVRQIPAVFVKSDPREWA